MSWIPYTAESDFSIYNLPFGVFSTSNKGRSCSNDPKSIRQQQQQRRRCATIIGDTVIDLSVLEEAGVFLNITQLRSNVFNQSTLNAFIQHPEQVWLDVRVCLLHLLQTNPRNPMLQNNQNLQNSAFYNINNNGNLDDIVVTLHVPIMIGDYTDFYASREHATNVGTMFRGASNALQPNWLHLPVGYHGRSSTVFTSGTPIRRPSGQLQKDPQNPTAGSIHSPCQQLDFELEMGAVVGGTFHNNNDSNNHQSQHPLTIRQAKQHIFGFVLLNDWSARDIQKWEYVPLGPFTSKNFATTISPWIVTTAALEGYMGEESSVNKYSFVAPTSAIQQINPIPLEYLQDPDYSSYDVKLSVSIETSSSLTSLQKIPTIICQSNFRNMYWNAPQLLTHHSVTGCIMSPGDLLGSGTISGSTPDSFGSLLELTYNGTQDIQVGDGETRKFLNDGDTVTMKGVCELGTVRIGFGECKGTVLPAITQCDKNAVKDVMDDNIVDRYHDFILYGYWKSSSSWRVRIALEAKGISYQTIPINLEAGEHKSPEFLEKNPLGQVPVLQMTDQYTGDKLQLSQSLAIVTFLDEIFPSRRSLLPHDPIQKAAALEIVEMINAGIQPQQNRFFLQNIASMSTGPISMDVDAVLISRIECGMIAVEARIRKYREYLPEATTGPYSLGTFSPSIVDVFIIPQLYNARKTNVAVATICPTVVEIETACMQHAWFINTRPTIQPGTSQDE